MHKQTKKTNSADLLHIVEEATAHRIPRTLFLVHLIPALQNCVQDYCRRMFLSKHIFYGIAPDSMELYQSYIRYERKTTNRKSLHKIFKTAQVLHLNYGEIPFRYAKTILPQMQNLRKISIKHTDRLTNQTTKFFVFLSKIWTRIEQVEIEYTRSMILGTGYLIQRQPNLKSVILSLSTEAQIAYQDEICFFQNRCAQLKKIEHFDFKHKHQFSLEKEAQEYFNLLSKFPNLKSQHVQIKSKTTPSMLYCLFSLLIHSVPLKELTLSIEHLKAGQADNIIRTMKAASNDLNLSKFSLKYVCPYPTFTNILFLGAFSHFIGSQNQLKILKIDFLIDLEEAWDAYAKFYNFIPKLQQLVEFDFILEDMPIPGREKEVLARIGKDLAALPKLTYLDLEIRTAQDLMGEIFLHLNPLKLQRLDLKFTLEKNNPEALKIAKFLQTQVLLTDLRLTMENTSMSGNEASIPKSFLELLPSLKQLKNLFIDFSDYYFDTQSLNFTEYFKNPSLKSLVIWFHSIDGKPIRKLITVLRAMSWLRRFEVKAEMMYGTNLDIEEAIEGTDFHSTNAVIEIGSRKIFTNDNYIKKLGPKEKPKSTSILLFRK